MASEQNQINAEKMKILKFKILLKKHTAKHKLSRTIVWNSIFWI